MAIEPAGSTRLVVGDRLVRDLSSAVSPRPAADLSLFRLRNKPVCAHP
jgi:hypothetical protein